MIQLIIFDWDDVITLGSRDGYFACYRGALDALGIEMEEAEFRSRILAKWGSRHRIEIEHLLESRPDLVDRACEEYRRQFYSGVFLSHLRLPGDVAGLLRRLAERYTLAVSTGAQPQFLRENVIPHFRIPEVFSRILTTYDVPDRSFNKPHPWMIDRIREHTGIGREATVMVGDARQDMEMAKNAGVHSVAVLTGHLSERQARELEVDRIIASVMDLESCLQEF